MRIFGKQEKKVLMKNMEIKMEIYIAVVAKGDWFENEQF